MKTKVQKLSRNDELKISIDADLTVARVRDLREEWSSYLTADQNLRIDTSKVNQVDSAGLQLLIAFALANTKQGKTVTWAGHSKPVMAVLELLDMGRYLTDETC